MHTALDNADPARVRGEANSDSQPAQCVGSDRQVLRHGLRVEAEMQRLGSQGQERRSSCSRGGCAPPPSPSARIGLGVGDLGSFRGLLMACRASYLSLHLRFRQTWRRYHHGVSLGTLASWEATGGTCRLLFGPENQCGGWRCFLMLPAYCSVRRARSGKGGEARIGLPTCPVSWPWPRLCCSWLGGPCPPVLGADRLGREVSSAQPRQNSPLTSISPVPSACGNSQRQN